VSTVQKRSGLLLIRQCGSHRHLGRFMEIMNPFASLLALGYGSVRSIDFASGYAEGAFVHAGTEAANSF
jgi:hypothetical protein